MRTLGLAVVAAVTLSSCMIGSDTADPDAGSSPTPADTTVATEEIPSLGRLLRVDEVEDCMFKENIPPDQSAIESMGLLAWLASHVESDRQLDLSIDISDLRLLDGSAFNEAIGKLVPDVTAKEEDRLRMLAWALGLAPHGIDVNAFLEGNEATLIAGLYDQANGDILLRSNKEDRPTPRAIVTLAHELTHAATDQAYGLREGHRVDVVDDAALAYRSAVEGDASLVEFRFISRFSPDKAMEKGLAYQIAMEDRLERFRSGVPEMLIDAAVFPYQWGFGFVCAIYKERGWAGINKIYGEKPPVTTAQIMFPVRYLSGENAVRPRALPELERPWRPIASGTIGAAHLKSLFEAPGNIGESALDKPVGRAAAWAGGTYQLWESDKERFGSLALGLVEHERYPGVLCSSMKEWYEAAFPEAVVLESTNTFASYEDDAQDAVIRCDGSEIRVGISPDAEIADALTR